ncbi:MAG: ROK family protein [Candidatus Krumholzibacteriota bacterium]|nr:ROK family protein [Candidatus Krumholzibacteriota bacterium]
MRTLLGIDIGGTDIKVGVVSAAGEVRARGTLPTRADEGPGPAAARVAAWVAESAAGAAIDAAGVGCAGLVDAGSGRLLYSPNMLAWNDTPIAALFGKALSCPVFVENDVNCAAYGEYKEGAGRDASHFFCIALGTGVGGGFVADGALYRGARGMACEIGHTIIDIDGPLCSCGCRGCLEAHVGAGAILDRARRILPGGKLAGRDAFSVKDLAGAAAAGDEATRRVFEETGRYLGVGIANVVQLFDPDAIALGGGVMGAGTLILEPARRSFREHAMNEALATARIVPAELGNAAAFIGAALLAADRA